MRYILTLSCDDQPGIIFSVSQAIAAHGGNILEAQQHSDSQQRRFFMRIEMQLPAGEVNAFRIALDGVGKAFAMAWEMIDTERRQRVLLMVSRFDHCLADLLYRWRIGELSMDVVGIVSNHPIETYAGIDFAGIPFHHLPVDKESKSRQEAQVKAVVEASSAELVILARYMQILSDDLATWLSGRCINIHHSFLPGFKGAKPYHQAHVRGVKLIGATAHYVTADLDEGPIIEQDVERISHADQPDDLVRKGRDIERRVLARAVKFHLERRSLMNGATTVVFRD